MKDFLQQAKVAAGRGVQFTDGLGCTWALDYVDDKYAVWTNGTDPIAVKTYLKETGVVYVVVGPDYQHLGGGWLPIELPTTPDAQFAAYLEVMESVIEIVVDSYLAATTAPEDGAVPVTEPGSASKQFDEPAKPTLRGAIQSQDEAGIVKLATGKRLPADTILDIYQVARAKRSNKLMNLVRSLRVESAALAANQVVRQLLEAGLDWRPRRKSFRVGQAVKPTAGRFLGDEGRVRAVFPDVSEVNVEFPHAGMVVKYAFDDLRPAEPDFLRTYLPALAVESLQRVGALLESELREFTGVDWYSYGGAEQGPKGEKPLIAEGVRFGGPRVDDVGGSPAGQRYADIVVDANGVQLHVYDEGGIETCANWVIETKYTAGKMLANGILQHQAILDEDFLTELGFEEIA